MKRAKLYFLFSLLLSTFFFLASCSQTTTTTTPSGNNGDDNMNPQVTSFVYKPFYSEHRDKFSLGDINDPYLFEVTGDYTNFAEIRILLRDETQGRMELFQITRMEEDDRVFLGLANFPYSANFNLDPSFTSSIYQNLSFGLVLSNFNEGSPPVASRVSDISKTGAGQIYTWRGLQNITNNISGRDISGRSYVQMNDITFPNPGERGFPDAGFSPIGSAGDPFLANYNGSNFTINNFYINRPSLDDVGLFGRVGSNGVNNPITLKNLVVSIASITGGARVGALIGDLNAVSQLTTVTNVRVIPSGGADSSASITGNSLVGGLIGRLESNDEVINGSAAINIAGSGNSKGGLIGVLSGDRNNINGNATGEVSSDDFLGGLIGQISGDGNTVSGFATGDVAGNQSVGGLIGTISLGGDNNTIIGYAEGSVSSRNSTTAGGLIGNAPGSGNEINGYATGVVSAPDINSGGPFGGVIKSGGGVSGGDGAGTESIRNQYNAYWDESSTGFPDDTTTAPNIGRGISSISNVHFVSSDSSPDRYEDRRTGATNQVFTNATFLNYFNLPGESFEWPTLK